MTGRVIRASTHTTIRYEQAKPGELAHMDIAGLSRIPDDGGWRGNVRACSG